MVKIGNPRAWENVEGWGGAGGEGIRDITDQGQNGPPQDKTDHVKDKTDHVL